MREQDFMLIALEEAKKGSASGEVPVGAVIVKNDEVIASAHNSPISMKDPTAHAEVLALRSAAQTLGAYRIPGVDMFVTLEPCMMCFGALIHARIRRLVFGADDPKVGFSRTYEVIKTDVFLNHRMEIVSGIMQDECALLLKDFFRQRR